MTENNATMVHSTTTHILVHINADPTALFLTVVMALAIQMRSAMTESTTTTSCLVLAELTVVLDIAVMLSLITHWVRNVTMELQTHHQAGACLTANSVADLDSLLLEPPKNVMKERTTRTPMEQLAAPIVPSENVVTELLTIHSGRSAILQELDVLLIVHFFVETEFLTQEKSVTSEQPMMTLSLTTAVLTAATSPVVTVFATIMSNATLELKTPMPLMLLADLLVLFLVAVMELLTPNMSNAMMVITKVVMVAPLHVIGSAEMDTRTLMRSVMMEI